MSIKLSTVIEKDINGYYAYCPELKGCQTQGDTLDEAYENLKEAIDLYLETLREDELNDISSQEILTGSYEAKVG